MGGIRIGKGGAKSGRLDFEEGREREDKHDTKRVVSIGRRRQKLAKGKWSGLVAGLNSGGENELLSCSGGKFLTLLNNI